MKNNVLIKEFCDKARNAVVVWNYV